MPQEEVEVIVVTAPRILPNSGGTSIFFMSGGGSGTGGGSGGGNGGSSGQSQSGSSPDNPIDKDEPLTPEEIAKLVAFFEQLRDSIFKSLASSGLTPQQISQLEVVERGLGEILDKLLNTSSITLNLIEGDLSSAGVTALSWAAGFLVTAGLSAAGTTAVVSFLAGAVTGVAIETVANWITNDIEAYLERELGPGGEISNTTWDNIFCKLVGGACMQLLEPFPPIIIDLENNGLDILALTDSSTEYDIDEDGFNETVSWPNNNEAILVIDHDKDNTVSHVNEFSFARFAGPGKTDLDGLRTFDSNNDEIIDIEDEVFEQLLIWNDQNLNGVSEQGELESFKNSGYSNIQLFLSDDTKWYENDAKQFGSVVINHAHNPEMNLTAYDVALYGTREGIKRHEFSKHESILIHENNENTLDTRNSKESYDITIGYEYQNTGFIIHHAKLGSGDDTVTIRSGQTAAIELGKGDDFVTGGDYPDTVTGQSGNDTIYGYGDSDHLEGGKGQDILFGGDDNDTLLGGKGKDVLDGGKGVNTLFGGKGKDVFVAVEGQQNINDFQPGKDKILVSENNLQSFIDKNTELRIEDGGLAISFPDNTKVWLKNLNEDSIYTDDFITSF